MLSANHELLPSQTAHYMATDQTGKQQVMVAATMPPGALRAGRSRPLRFIIMTSVKQQSSSRSRRKKRLSLKPTRKPHIDAWEPPPPFIGVGNPGTDDLNSFPIENSHTVSIAIDFITKHMMPGRSKLPHQEKMPNIFLPFLRLSMDNEYLFECIVALALAYRDNDIYGESKMTPAIAYHNGRALACLRERLRGPRAYDDDAAIMTTIFLGDLATKFGTSAEVTAHSAALEDMVTMRGGLDSLGHDGLLKSMIEYVSTIGDLPGVSKDDEIPTRSNSRSAQSESPSDLPAIRQTTLEYLKHPFSPEICALVAALPEGFRELALNCHLSIEVIGLIDLAQRQLFVSKNRLLHLKDYCPANIIMHAKRYLQVSTRLTESLVCLSIMLISMRSFCYRFSPQKYLFPKKLLLLAQQRGPEEATPEQHQHFVWTALLTAEACQCQPLMKYVEPLMAETFALSAHNDAKADGWLQDWSKLQNVMKKFLWTRDMLYEWRDTWEVTMRRLKTGGQQTSQLFCEKAFVS